VQERVVREIRMLRAMRRALETGLRKLLIGHEGGNAGHRQGVSFGLPRQCSTLIGIRDGFDKGRECLDRGGGFFLFGFFSFFEVGCGNVENPRADRALATNTRPNHTMVNGRRSSQGEVRRKGCILRCCPSRTRL
jgi:hypothetical protein